MIVYASGTRIVIASEGAVVALVACSTNPMQDFKDQRLDTRSVKQDSIVCLRLGAQSPSRFGYLFETRRMKLELTRSQS